MEFIDFMINISLLFIGLTVTIYALAVPLFHTQIRRNKVFLESRLDELEKKVESLTKGRRSRESLDVIETEVRQYKNEEKLLSFKLSCLKLRGAVIYPSIVFFLGLLIFIFYEDLIMWIPNNAITIGTKNFTLVMLIGTLTFFYGIYRVICTLMAIDYASTNILMPNFDVHFLDGSKKLTSKINEPISFDIAIENKGYEIGELIDVYLAFPPQIHIIESEDFFVFQESEHDDEYPNYWRVSYYSDYIHAGSNEIMTINIEPLTVANKYTIPIWVIEKNSGDIEFDLEMEIIE
jgi:hypothetical protein